MINPEQFLILSFLFPGLYAETHYRFKYFFSWLKKAEPEIIADIPSRIQRGDQLPVLLIVKDSDKYDSELLNVEVWEKDLKLIELEINKKLNQPYYDKIFFLETSDLEPGKHYFNVKIKYKIKDKIKICHNDNHRGTKHKPIPVYISQDPFPQIDTCIFGETHSHTNYTSDQLEFGASLNSTSILAQSMGLNFFCATDHSYDLDDQENNYLKNDKNLPKWKKLLEEVDQINDTLNNFQIIAGEEASLHNSKNKNIHCLIYNSKKFYPGNGDSGEKWLHPFSELTIDDVLNDVNEETLVFAAHPVEPVPFLQKILIRRDNWHIEDCLHKRLNGLQFANGGPKKYFKQGKNLWIKLLLKGHKLTGLAGNDAHGNFARYRQVSFPFIKMKENYFHLFGNWRTGVYLNSKRLDNDSILTSIKNGNCFLTNGPALNFQAFTNRKLLPMGSTCEKLNKLKLEVISTEEFGKIKQVSIFQGLIGEKSEKVTFHKILSEFHFNYEYELNAEPENANGYYRLEVETELNKIALSNPIWFSDMDS